MHPTSEPAHESSSQTSPGAAKRTYDERAAFEEAKRNLGIVGDREQEFNRGLAILGKAYSIGMTLILVYFLLDAYQILVTAGRSLNIGSFLSYALPKVLPDAILVVPFLWIVLGWVKAVLLERCAFFRRCFWYGSGAFPCVHCSGSGFASCRRFVYRDAGSGCGHYGG